MSAGVIDKPGDLAAEAIRIAEIESALREKRVADLLMLAASMSKTLHIISIKSPPLTVSRGTESANKEYFPSCSMESFEASSLSIFLSIFPDKFEGVHASGI